MAALRCRSARSVAPGREQHPLSGACRKKCERDVRPLCHGTPTAARWLVALRGSPGPSGARCVAGAYRLGSTRSLLGLREASGTGEVPPSRALGPACAGPVVRRRTGAVHRRRPKRCGAAARRNRRAARRARRRSGRLRFLRVHREAGLAVLLHPVERAVRMRHQRAGIVAVRRRHCDPDATASTTVAASSSIGCATASRMR